MLAQASDVIYDANMKDFERSAGDPIRPSTHLVKWRRKENFPPDGDADQRLVKTR